MFLCQLKVVVVSVFRCLKKKTPRVGVSLPPSSNS